MQKVGLKRLRGPEHIFRRVNDQRKTQCSEKKEYHHDKHTTTIFSASSYKNQSFDDLLISMRTQIKRKLIKRRQNICKTEGNEKIPENLNQKISVLDNWIQKKGPLYDIKVENPKDKQPTSSQSLITAYGKQWLSKIVRRSKHSRCFYQTKNSFRGARQQQNFIIKKINPQEGIANYRKTSNCLAFMGKTSQQNQNSNKFSVIEFSSENQIKQMINIKNYEQQNLQNDKQQKLRLRQKQGISQIFKRPHKNRQISDYAQKKANAESQIWNFEPW